MEYLKKPAQYNKHTRMKCSIAISVILNFILFFYGQGDSRSKVGIIICAGKLEDKIDYHYQILHSTVYSQFGKPSYTVDPCINSISLLCWTRNHAWRLYEIFIYLPRCYVFLLAILIDGCTVYSQGELFDICT